MAQFREVLKVIWGRFTRKIGAYLNMTAGNLGDNFPVLAGKFFVNGK